MKMMVPALFLASCCLADFEDTRQLSMQLQDEPEVLVNSQGLAQQDLSIRGGSYTGSGMSINGLNLRVPYSAHFNSELPFPGNLFGSADVRNGLKNASGHLVGTAAYSTRPMNVQSQYSAAIGTRENYRATLFSRSENIGAFVDWNKARTVDHGGNDMNRFAGSAFVQFLQNDWLFDILAAGQTKEFGAQGYYGIPSAVYAEEQTDDTLLFFSASKGDVYDSYIRASASVRAFNDEYRIPSSFFANDARSHHGAFAIEGRTMEIQHIALNLRGDAEHSRVSGDVGSHHRTRASVTVLPEARFERVVFKAGLNSVVQSDESAEWLPLAGIDFMATDNSTVFFSYTETEQQPDYQTLYYADPFRTGNSMLAQQLSRNTEVGFRQFLSASLDWQLTGFFRQVENASDWTQTTAGGIWTATDLGTLNVGGIDASLTYLASENLGVRLFYQWLGKESYDAYAGMYELDYPEHMLNLSAYWRFFETYLLEFSQTTRYQTANRARSGTDFGADASLGLHYEPYFAKNVRLSFLAENLWNSDFQSIPGLKARPSTASLELTASW
jgi:iron complex outermembrane receptor protein